MKNLIIVGAGAMAREILWIVKEINAVEPTWDVQGFLDFYEDGRSLEGFECSHKVIGQISTWQPKLDEWYAMGIQDSKYKRINAKILKDKGAQFTSLIHPNCCVSDTAVYGEGFILYPYCKLGPNCHIGDFVASQSSIPHDCVIGDYSKISSQCGIGGGVIMGHDVFIATSVSIVPHVHIGDNSQCGIGSVVISNVKSNTKVFGNPAKKIDF